MLNFIKKTIKIFFKLLLFHKVLNLLRIDIYRIINLIKAIPKIIKTYFIYLRQSDKNFTNKKINLIFGDINDDAGDVIMHYFHQDLFVAKKIYEDRPKQHIDIGSRLDGFVSNVLTFMPVTMVDIRPLKNKINGLNFVQGCGEDLSNIKTETVESLSCLHALEHFGLGRYGDPVDLNSIYKTANEFVRVLKNGGKLYFSTPVSKENTIIFNSERIFNPKFVVEELFSELNLIEMHLVNDKNELIKYVSFDLMQQQKYGCGIFIFEKK